MNHLGPKEGIAAMRMDRTVATVVGSLILGSTIASAGLPWNPFSSEKSEPATATTSDTSRSTNFFKSPFDLLPKRDVFSTSSAPSVDSVNQPVTDETRKLIFEESRQYPLGQRQKFISTFVKLNDREARLLLQKYQLAKINQKAPSASTSQTAAARTNGSPGQVSLRTSRPQTSSNTQQTDAVTQGLGKANPWDRRSAYSAETEQSASQTSSRSLKDKQTASNHTPYVPSQAGSANSSTQYRPVSHNQTSGSSIPVRHAIHSRSADDKTDGSMPKVTPAGGDQNTTHYASHYRPVSAVEPQTGMSAPHVSQAGISRDPQAGMPVLPPSAQSPFVGPELAQLIARAETAAKSSTPGQTDQQLQEHITRHVELRLLYLISGQRDLALTAIPIDDVDEQIFWTRVFWSLSSYLDAANYPDKTDRTTVSIEQMRSAIKSLQGKAHLTIRSATFCSDIESFGNYTRFGRDEFSVGQEILVYSELDNFRSERTAEGHYRTLLKSSLRVYSAGNESRVVDEVQYNATEDLCRSHRQDFMQGFKYRLPKQMTPGAYVMRLIIEDQLSGKSTEYSLNFIVR